MRLFYGFRAGLHLLPPCEKHLQDNTRENNKREPALRANQLCEVIPGLPTGPGAAEGVWGQQGTA